MIAVLHHHGDLWWFWNPAGHWAVFWGGIGSCIGEFAIFGVLWKKLACHSTGCHRIGLHHVEGTPYICCKKHHPAVPNKGASAEHIAKAHESASALCGYALGTSMVTTAPCDRPKGHDGKHAATPK